MASSARFRFAAIAVLALSFSVFLLPSTWRPGCDFTWRHNEVRCLRSGLDPYDVCFLGAESPEYCSVFHPEPGKKPVNAYSPWQYTWFLPLSHLPLRTAHTVFMLLNLGALALIAVLAGRMGCKCCRGFKSCRGYRSCDDDGKRCNTCNFCNTCQPLQQSTLSLVIASAACFLGLGLVRVLQVSNYGLLMAAALMLLATVPNAGPLALCVLMVKPQIGILFVIPLLLSRRYRTVFGAVLLCGLSVLPAAALCHGNPVQMVLRVVFSGTHSIRAAEVGTGLLPPPLIAKLSAFAPASVWLAVSAVAGFGLCLWGSWRLRKHPDFAVRLLPAATISLLWMQGHFHDRVILALPLAVFATAALRGNRRAAWMYLLFTAEFWFCLFGGIAALFLSGSPMDILHHPQARTAYDIFLCIAGIAQVSFVLNTGIQKVSLRGC